MPCLRILGVLCLFCFQTLVCGSALGEPRQVRVKCDDLMNSLQRFIRIRTDMAISYDTANCMSSSLMQTFVRETSAMLVIHEAPVTSTKSTEETSMHIELRDDDIDLANMLVLALIGRHYTVEYQTGQVFFEFDPITQITTANMPRCEYQRSFFVMLLFVSVVLMIFSLVMQNFHSMPMVPQLMKDAGRVEASGPLSTTHPAHPLIPVATLAAKMNMGGFANSFANVRRTGVSVIPTSCGRQRLVVDGTA